MTSLIEFAEKLKSQKKVAIFCHIRPDGDTVGSGLALSLALNSLGIENAVFCEDKFTDKMNYLVGFDSVKQEYNGDFYKDFTARIAVDSADEERLGIFSSAFQNKINTFNIDHHVSNTRYAEFNFVEENGANCENMFNLITLLGVEITKEIAMCLATGVVTDTGNFRHKNVTENTFIIASKLLKAGADFNYIVYTHFNKQTKERAKLFGIVMQNIRYYLNNKFAVAVIREKDFIDTKAKQDETEGFIDFVMGIDCVEVGACVMEMEKNKYKISLRSKGADVNVVAGYFGGGGHVMASGCRISGELEEVIDRLQFAVSRVIE